MNTKKLKIICIYQVIMHYRIPFYEALTNENSFDFKLFYGTGTKGTKLSNADIKTKKINCEQLRDYKIPVGVPMSFTPILFFKLIREKPDIIFSEGSSSLINSSIAFIYAKLFNKKFIWWSLGALKNSNKKGIRKLFTYWEKIIETKSNAIFTYSTQGFNHFVKRGVSPNKIFVGVNVFDTSLKLKEINETFEDGFISKIPFNIAFIGTIQKTKNLELLIDVVNKMNFKYGDNCVNLHIIGDGEYLPELKKYSKDNKTIIYYGRMNRGSSRVLKNCDIMVIPGLGGLAIVEGMLNSLPIVTGWADGTEYDLIDESNGAIIENMDFTNLMNKLEYFFNNREILKDLGANSLYKITNEYSFDNYFKVFKSMINFVNK